VSRGVIAAPEGGGTPASERLVLRRGLDIVPLGRALLVDGGLRRHLLKGRAIAAILPILPALLPLLEGDHDRAGICAQAGLDRATLDEFLGLLAECEALEPAGRNQSGTETLPAGHVTTFLSRTVRAGDGYRSGAELAAVLAGSSVLIVAPPELSEQIAADLTETGVGSVVAADGPGQVSAAWLRTASSAVRKIAAVFDPRPIGSGGDDLAEAMSRCHAHGLAVLRFACDTGLEIGPTFFVSNSVCVDCFRRGHDAMARREHGPGDDVACSPLVDLLAADGVLAGLVSAEVLALLCGPKARAPHRRLARMVLPGYQVERYDLVPEPGCSRCGGWRSSHDAATIAEAYEWLERTDPAQASGPYTACPAGPQGNKPSKAWPDDLALGPRIALPTGRSKLADHGVTDILGQVASWRPAAVAVAAPRSQAGDDDVTSVRVYLLTDGTLTDLPATIFRHDNITGELVGARADLVPLARALKGTDLASEELDFAVVLVAAVGELRRRYGTFALRLSHLDAGCAATQLSAAAASRGRRVSFAGSWSQELSDLLELDPDDEIVAAVAGIHRPPEVSALCR
jgi:hypothetical protein